MHELQVEIGAPLALLFARGVTISPCQLHAVVRRQRDTLDADLHLLCVNTENTPASPLLPVELNDKRLALTDDVRSRRPLGRLNLAIPSPRRVASERTRDYTGRVVASSC